MEEKKDKKLKVRNYRIEGQQKKEKKSEKKI